MEPKLTRKVAVGAVAGLAVAGGGAALAATQFSTPGAESQAVVSDAAKQLGVQPSALTDALKKALENRVDAAVAAGALTKEQGDTLKSKIESSDFPLFGVPHGGFGHGGFGHGGFGFHHFAGLDAAASYLGVTEDALRSELEGGKTLAQVAKEKDKSVDGLVQAITDAEKKDLDEAVADGRLTKEQEQSILSDLKQRVTDVVNGKGGFGLHFGGSHGRFSAWTA